MRRPAYECKRVGESARAHQIVTEAAQDDEPFGSLDFFLQNLPVLL